MKNTDLLSLLTVRTEKVKLECLKNTDFKDMEFTLREMNIAQNKKHREILSNLDDTDRFNKSMINACMSVMVEPAFFTEEELDRMNGIGEAVINEIFMKIPTIGMSAKEKKEYQKRIEEFAKKATILEESQDEEEVEKK